MDAKTIEDARHGYGLTGERITSMDEARAVARRITDATGERHIATDAGSHTSPRYAVIDAPKIGTAVSMGFNGDYYPCGQIARISESLRRVVTTDGTVFYRRCESATWVRKGGTFCLVAGTRNERNPSF